MPLLLIILPIEFYIDIIYTIFRVLMFEMCWTSKLNNVQGYLQHFHGHPGLETLITCLCDILWVILGLILLGTPSFDSLQT